MKAFRTLPILLLVASLASCANLELRHSGFLDHYEQLEPAPEAQVWGVPDEVELYRVDDLPGKYDKIILEPSVYHELPDVDDRPTKHKARKLLDYYDKSLRKYLGEDFEIVDTPGPRTARLRAAMTELDGQAPWLNWLGLLLIVPIDMGGITGELEVVDSVTGERQLAMVAVREGTPFLLLESFSKYGHAKHGMTKWARFVRDAMKKKEE
ncbi:MAG TPA: DUF3313 domain-containing protein [Planctomycetes bacterium]|nr:DUF3313 domain-containing protein [Planctomycetota bacterium]